MVVGLDMRMWRTYKYGLFDGCQRSINNYALLVGRGIGYWKIKNSWGTKWGEKGFIRLKVTESSDVCGICLRGTYPYF